MTEAAERGWLAIAGLGPGADDLVTPEVAQALEAATDVVGYAPYIARVPERSGQARHASDNRVELDRAREGLRMAAEAYRTATGT
jgi:precorrin-3B C17-methyltransferase